MTCTSTNTCPDALHFGLNANATRPPLLPPAALHLNVASPATRLQIAVYADAAFLLRLCLSHNTVELETLLLVLLKFFVFTFSLVGLRPITRILDAPTSRNAPCPRPRHLHAPGTYPDCGSRARCDANGENSRAHWTLLRRGRTIVLVAATARVAFTPWCQWWALLIRLLSRGRCSVETTVRFGSYRRPCV
ncbi:hypothetical protein C8J57DRAFT_1340047 [Mycena rebaudengoi]|nr:hypothetical protein C8J57DRAFT_1340047 [Mycena rebaudengoi]